MTVGSRYRYDIYARSALPGLMGGSPLVSLTTAGADQLVSAGWRAELNGIGWVKLSINRNSAYATAANFADRNYVVAYDTVLAKPIWGGFMPKGTAKLLSNREKGGQLLTMTMPGQMSYVGEYVWLNTPYVAPGGGTGVGNATNAPRDDGLWHWPNNRYGSILERMYLEGVDPDRPDTPFPGLQTDFTYLTDSAGATFTAYTGDYTQPIGTDGLDTVADSIRLGLTVLVKPYLTMQAFQGDYGTDRHSASFASGKVRFVNAVNIDSDLDRSLEPSAQVRKLIVQGSSQLPADFVIVTDSTASADAGEAYLQYGITNDAGVLADAGAKNLALRKAQTNVFRFPTRPAHSPTTGFYVPSWPGDGGDVWLGDTVTLVTGSGNLDVNMSIRVAAIECQSRAGGDDDIYYELGATFIDFGRPGLPGTTAPATSQPCTCGPVPAVQCIGGASEATYEHWTWDDPGVPNWPGAETIMHAYGGGTAAFYGRSTLTGLGGTTYAGHMGNTCGVSGQIAVTPGTTYRFHGLTRNYGTSWGVCPSGSSNISAIVLWYNAANAVISRDQLYQFSCSSGERSFDTTLTAPAGAVRCAFQCAHDLSGASLLPGETGNATIDEFTMAIVTGGFTDPLCTTITYGADFVPGPPGTYIPAGSVLPAPSADVIPTDQGFLQPVLDDLLNRSLHVVSPNVIIDGGGSVITTGIKTPAIYVPFACLLEGWRIELEPSGSIDLDVLVTPAGGLPAAGGDSIVGGGTDPSVTSALEDSSDDTTDWDSQEIPADSWLSVDVVSVSTATKCNFAPRLVPTY